MNPEAPSPELDDDYLIARSGIIGRQVLKLARFIHGDGDRASARAGLVAQPGPALKRVRAILRDSWVSRLVNLLYTYYIGGSLTRSDQHTFARIHGMRARAYRLTLYNAIFCGIPCALGYFFLGEGFSLLKEVHSYAELPSLLASHTSLAVGLLSFAVDVLRAGDAWLNRRCWAPFGIFPLVINIPTYLKRLLHRQSW
jgi:hypothetical protein